MHSHHRHNPSESPRPFAARARATVASGGAIVLVAGLLSSSALAGGGVGTDGGGTGGTGGGGTGGGGTGGGHSHAFPVPGQHTYGDGWGAGRDHAGQDVFADCGQKLVAVQDGRVEQIDNQGNEGYGRSLIISGNGDISYLYGHMKGKPTVREGQRVNVGQKVGLVGETGNATGCHVHFERRKAGSPQASVTRVLKKWDKYS